MHATTAHDVEDHTRSLVTAWAILVALTLTSYWFRDHTLGSAAAVIAILVITFVKVFMVGHSFMEVRRAPMMLRGIFTAWCAGTCLILIVLAFEF